MTFKSNYFILEEVFVPLQVYYGKLSQVFLSPEEIFWLVERVTVANRAVIYCGTDIITLKYNYPRVSSSHTFIINKHIIFSEQVSKSCTAA